MDNWASFRYPHLFNIWDAWCAEENWNQLDRWLKRYYQTQKQFGKKDRMVYSNAMFSAMRNLQHIEALELAYKKGHDQDWKKWDNKWHTSQVSNLGTPYFWYWLAMIHDVNAPAPKELPDAEKRNQWFIDNYQGSSDKLTSDFDYFRYGWRPRWNESLKDRSKTSLWNEQQQLDFIQGQNRLPPIWLRPQQLTTPEALYRMLLAEGVNVTLEHNRVSASGGKGLLETVAFKQGLFEIQDLASQHISESVEAKPGDKIWDVCAGAGGKSLAIAEQLQNKGIVLATDIREFKLKELKRRAKKASYFNIRTFGWDAESPLTQPKEVRVQGGFDWVLIDAPCTSTGTWRRNPDARWRETAIPDADLLALQQKILNQACLAVKTGGHLVYATCSWMLQENEHQVQQFLDSHPEFQLTRQSMWGFPEIDSDTMYSAVLQRAAI